MNEFAPPHPSRLATTIITPSIDELSSIRYVHAQSLRNVASAWTGAEDAAAYAELVYTPAYGGDIEHAIRASTFFSAYVGDQLVGTSGWSPVDGEDEVARIRWCHVQPMFAKLGIGLSLLLTAERTAEDHGYTSLVARATPNAAGFFERAGYGITSHGTRPLPGGRNFPVTFLRKRLRAAPGLEPL